MLTNLSWLLYPLFVNFLDFYKVHSVALVGLHFETVALEDHLSGAEMVTGLIRAAFVALLNCTFPSSILWRQNTYIYQSYFFSMLFLFFTS